MDKNLPLSQMGIDWGQVIPSPFKAVGLGIDWGQVTPSPFKAVRLGIDWGQVIPSSSDLLRPLLSYT